jgi:two-component system KDP operon response regulator KdpE
MNAASTLVLLVEDEPPMRRFLRASLTSQGFRLIEATTAREALAMATSHRPDLVLLDLGLPDGDGIEITRELRKGSNVPIIVISARGREDDKVAALDAGADDYLTKPFGINELLARIRVAQRHAQQANPSSPLEALELGGLCIDLTLREVRVSDRPVHLTPTEYRILVLLAQNAGRVLTHKQILKSVWSSEHVSHAHALRVHMAGLRKKIEPDPAHPQWLVNEPGVGYRLRDRSSEPQTR